MQRLICVFIVCEGYKNNNFIQFVCGVSWSYSLVSLQAGDFCILICCLLIFFKIKLQNTIKMSNTFDLDQARHFAKVISKRYQYIEDIQMFLLNMSFISRVKLTIFIFHEWRSHE